MRKPLEKKISKECEICKKSYKTSKFWAKYCSNTCRQIGWLRMKEKEMGLNK
jgi:hypothetical protein